MKIKIGIIVALYISVLLLPAHANQSAFITQINAAWSISNYPEILRLINAAKATHPVAPEVYAASFAYSMTILGDRPQATQALTDLLASLPPTATRAIGAIQAYKDAFVALPAGSSSGRTAAQLAQIHARFLSELPMEPLLTAISAGR